MALKSKKRGLSEGEMDTLEAIIRRHGTRRIVKFLAEYTEDMTLEATQKGDPRNVINSWAHDARVLDNCADQLED